MNITKDNIENRVIFLDNLRYFSVLCVVLLHSGLAYFPVMTWWVVVDANTNIIAGWLVVFFGGFAMPLLFYISGYFAIPTIQKQEITSFLKGKLKRLGVPWLICILFIIPASRLIYHYSQNNLSLSVSYWDLWMILMKDASAFNVGLINIDKAMKNNQFSQNYMWFLSLLILFFFAFSIIYKVKKRWFVSNGHPVPSAKMAILSTLKFLVAVGLLTFLCSLISIAIVVISSKKPFDPEEWFTLGNVIQFQPYRLPLYIIYFAMGIITYKNKWIERGKFSGDYNTWLISLPILAAGHLYVFTILINAPIQLRTMYGLASLFILNFLSISALGFFTSFALRYWNHPTRINQSLASNSYNIYLSHFIFVVGFQLLLFTYSGISGLLKFGIVSALSIACAYIVSQFLIKPYTRISIGTVIMLFIIMIVFIRP